MDTDNLANRLLDILQAEGIDCGLDGSSESTSTRYLYVRRPTPYIDEDGDLIDDDETARIRISDHGNATLPDCTYARFFNISPAPDGYRFDDGVAAIIEWARS